jgi:hypothetical protein
LPLAADVQISKDGKGRALNTIVVDRLWRSVKVGELSTDEGIGKALSEP